MEKAPSALSQRLLKDIKEIREYPYPNIFVSINDADIRSVCLILTPEQSDPLHLFVNFPNNYPLRAPAVSIQSNVVHPNVFGDYVCASILNTNEGWTPAYTLKAVAIQLLSFFSSDRLEQEYGGHIELSRYRDDGFSSAYRASSPQHYICSTCGFGAANAPQNAPTSTPIQIKRDGGMQNTGGRSIPVPHIPNEIWMQIFSEMDTLDVIAFSDAFPFIKDTLNSSDFIRTRELQCFCLKQNLLETKLGIGVSVEGGKRKTFRSEFDLISEEAVNHHKVSKSIQGVIFRYWLPLPLNQRHWNRVRRDAGPCIRALQCTANMDSEDLIDVLYSFMNSIVVQFSTDTENSLNQPNVRSTLNHASEKAVNSYFALFHLLLCLAVDRPEIVASANAKVSRFLAGRRTKKDVPDLGQLIVAAMISDAGLTQNLLFCIIRETIVRNVVWMLDNRPNCAGFAELAYREPDAVSGYRLRKTFEASKTSYRLLMFNKLFSSTARTPGKSLEELRDQLFDSHGAPPPHVSASVAQRTREIREIQSFADFFRAMQVEPGSIEKFCAFLKRSVTDSAEAGYSCEPLTQGQAYLLRRNKEKVERLDGLVVTRVDEQWQYGGGNVPEGSFFPGGDKVFARLFPGGRGGSGRYGREQGRGVGNGNGHSSGYPSTQGIGRSGWRGRGRGRGSAY